MRLSVLRVVPALVRRRPAESPLPAPSRRARARVALALLLPAFVLVLAAAWSAAESAAPEITDTDYHVRLRLIRAATAEHPEHPPALVLGSSRLVWGFRPDESPEPAPGELMWMNCAHVGAGPTLNRILLHRLLRDGVRPAVVAIEVMPTFFVKENSRFVCGHFAGTDLALARRYADKWLSYEYYFLRHRLTRAPDLARVADPFAGFVAPLPRGTHPHIEIEVTPEERARRTAFAYRMNGEYLRSMGVRPGADRAFRDTLREAAENGVRVVLLRAPEGPTFRSWYDPAGLARFDEYVAAAAAEYRVPVVDARLWLEEEDFSDSHHVLKRGADKFTARFIRALPAVLAGR